MKKGDTKSSKVLQDIEKFEKLGVDSDIVQVIMQDTNVP